jgi:hypothetical protein
MESKTLLLDPQSSTAERSIWRINPGCKFLASKVRLGNFRIQNNSGLPIYFGTQGIYSLILRVSLLNLDGTEIDRLAGDGLNMMAIRLLSAENGQQYSINRQLAQSMCDSITCPSPSQVQLTEVQGKDNACVLSAYIDISSMLKYLSARNIIDEGMIVQCEWNLPTMIQNGYSFDRYPCLFIDEIISDLPADKGTTFTFPTIISERLVIPYVAGGVLQTYAKRLNAYYNQYIANMYYFLITDPNYVQNVGNPFNLAYAPDQESMVFTTDGVMLIPFGSIDTVSKKLALLTDFNGPVTVPTLASVYNNVKAYLPDSDVAWGCKNPNTGVTMSGVQSYGCIKLARMITNDMTISYTANLLNESSSSLVMLAECMRVYNKTTGIVGNLSTNPVMLNV